MPSSLRAPPAAHVTRRRTGATVVLASNDTGLSYSASPWELRMRRICAAGRGMREDHKTAAERFCPLAIPPEPMLAASRPVLSQRAPPGTHKQLDLARFGARLEMHVGSLRIEAIGFDRGNDRGVLPEGCQASNERPTTRPAGSGAAAPASAVRTDATVQRCRRRDSGPVVWRGCHGQGRGNISRTVTGCRREHGRTG